MNRRDVLTGIGAGAAMLLADGFRIRASPRSEFRSADLPKLAITIDDPTTNAPALYDANKKNDLLLATLERHKIKAALFVCGKRVDSDAGKILVKSWSDAGHMICNHSYSHLYFNAPKLPFDVYRDDFLKGEAIIAGSASFKKFYRFPFLKEGETKEKRDGFRKLLADHGYQNGSVTIDTSDWYIDERLKARLKKDASANLDSYRDYYLAHVWDRARYYDKLAVEIEGRQIAHTILLHHTLTNALWLDGLITMFKSKGWLMIDAEQAFKDPIFNAQPEILPAGESLVWALAKQAGKIELRYPGEDDTYEKDAMDTLGL
ncbi:MAG: polysaccharide deacetylase family protein [Candidatus Kapaibacterium sp.]